METTLNQEAILAMLIERLKELTRSIKDAETEDELAEIAENISAASKAAKDSIERACGEGSLSDLEAAMSLHKLGDALDATLLLLMLKTVQIRRGEANE